MVFNLALMENLARQKYEMELKCIKLEDLLEQLKMVEGNQYLKDVLTLKAEIVKNEIEIWKIEINHTMRGRV